MKNTINVFVNMLKNMFSSKIFVAVLALKIAIALLFLSPSIYNGHLNFVQHFANEPFKNTYQFFSDRERFDVFPYPPLLMFLQGIPFIIANLLEISISSIYASALLKIPFLIADIILLFTLILFFKGNEKSIIFLYWCSPIIIYSTYFLGSPDIIAISLLMVSVYFLVEKKNILMSAVLLGLSIGSKTGIIMVLPFYAMYIWKKNKEFNNLIFFSSWLCITELIIILPYVFSSGFWAVGILSSQQTNIPNLSIIFENSLRFYLPLAIFSYLLYKAISFKKVTKDIFFMMIGISFILFTTTIIPKPGWYVWCVPFIVYLFIREGISKYMYVALNILYLGYFIISEKSEFLSSTWMISSKFTNHQTFFNILNSLGFPAQLFTNILFTMLVSTLIYISYVIWKKIIRKALIFEQTNGIPTIGISGDSSSGKTMLSNVLAKLFTKNNSTIICGDDVHKWERGDDNWKKYTHLNPLSNHIYTNYSQIKDLKFGKEISRKVYDHDTGKFTFPFKKKAKEIIIAEGLHTFFLQESNSIYDLKIFLKPDESLRRSWKIERDTTKRNQTVEKVIENLNRRAGDAFTFISPQEDYADIIIKVTPINRKESNIKKSAANKTKLIVDTNVDLDMEGFSSEFGIIGKSMKMSISYPNHRFQRFEFSGTASEEKIFNLISACLPEYENYGINKEGIQKDYNGVLQALCIYSLNFKIKKKLESERNV